MSKSFDVVIIGAGFLGLSTAYELSKQGIKTLLLDAGDISGGTSASCSGRAQTCEGHLDPLNIELIISGMQRHDSLEEELGQQYAWRRSGLFLIIRTQKSWDYWQNRLEQLNAAGIPTEVVDRAALQAAEPYMNTNDLLGAVYTKEGMLNPLRYCLAYAAAARRNGAVVQGRSRVIGLSVRNGHIVEVKTPQQNFFCGQVAVMAGAWSPELTRMVDIDLPIFHAHAEAMITEPIPARIFHNVEISDFYDTIHGKEKAVAIGIHPDPHGSLDISEAVTKSEQCHKGVSVFGLTTLAKELSLLYPFLAHVRVLRGWGRPTSFTADDEPIVGWVPPLDNLFVAASLLETITAVPVLSEWMALMLQGKQTPMSLELYSPARFLS